MAGSGLSPRKTWIGSIEIISMERMQFMSPWSDSFGKPACIAALNIASI